MTTETTPIDVPALRQSFAAAVEADPNLVNAFYIHLHEIRPDLWNPEHRPHFPPIGSPGMRVQVDRLSHALVDTLDHIEDGDYLAAMYSRLGQRHRELGALGDEDVISVGSALLWALGNALDKERWESDVYLQAQWVRAYETLITLMLAGADPAP